MRRKKDESDELDEEAWQHVAAERGQRAHDLMH